MSDPSLQLYKEIIDLLAGLGHGVHRLWVTERGWPTGFEGDAENRAINAFLATLSAEQKEMLAGLLESARDGGVHDALAVLHDRMAIEGLRFTEGGVEMAFEPFDTQLYYDWTCRRMGDPWPDEGE